MDGKDGVKRARLGARRALVAGFAIGLFAAWVCWLKREEDGEALPAEAVEGERLVLEQEPEALAAEAACEVELEPEDLTEIEGIGPKVEGVLRAAGIVTYRQLAGARPEALRRILRDEGLAFIDPETWPEQAASAAAGDWEGLEALKKELRGGRRPS
jgi:predicted flap endonuclease-1-like 5' DNA nuclease